MNELEREQSYLDSQIRKIDWELEFIWNYDQLTADEERHVDALLNEKQACEFRLEEIEIELRRKNNETH